MQHPGLYIEGNLVLDTLPKDVLQHLRPSLQPVTFQPEQVVYRPGDKMEFVYFPVAGAFSYSTLLHDGSSIEIAAVGSETLLGLSALNRDGISDYQLVNLGCGIGYRISASVLRDQMNQSVALRRVLRAVSQYAIAVSAQMAACSGRHGLVARVARLLLLMQDRLKTERLPMNQERLSALLGVQRSWVAATAAKLRTRRLIRYSRGQIDILDRIRLEATACECYQVLKDMSDHFLRE